MAGSAGLALLMAIIGLMGIDMITRRELIYAAGGIAVAHPCLASPLAKVLQLWGAGSTPSGPTYTQVFADDFNRSDSGTVGWTSETDTGSYLGIVSNTLQWSSTSTTSGYAEKSLGASYYAYKASTDFKANTVTTDTSGRAVQIMQVRSATNTTATVQVKATSTTLNTIEVIWYNEAASATTSSASYTFASNTNYTISLEVVTSTSTSANNGSIKLSINGASVIDLTGLDTYGRQVSVARLGVLYTSWATTSKVFTFDNYYFGENDA